MAVTNHPQVDQAKARIGVAAQENKVVKSDFFPTLSAGATAGRIYSDNATTRGLTTTRGAAYSGLGEGTASLQQPIFNGFGTSNRLKASRAAELSTSLQLQDVKEQVALQTVQAYLSVLEARSVLLRLQNQESKMNDYLNRIRTNVEDGGADNAKLQQAEDVRVLLNGFVADYTGQLKAAQSRYQELTGAAPMDDMQVPMVNGALIPTNIEEAIALAETEHPAIRASTAQATAAAFNIDAEKAELYPELVGELSYLKSDKVEEIGGEVEDRRAVLRLNWDFETGGAQYARIKQRHFEKSEALAREEEIRGQIERDIKITYAERDVAMKRLKNQRERVALNKKLFETYETQFDGGRVDLLQLMQADNQLFNTQIEETVYQYRLLGAQYNILASLGQLQQSVLAAAPTEGQKNSEPKK